MKNITTICALLLCCPALGGENAAPSSHMVFDDNFDGDILINEVRVPKNGEAMYTYYETLGWRGGAAGYGGIQVHPKAHLYIFSIWDHKKHTAPIKAVHKGPDTITQKFGGEGTGLKSWNFKLGWKPDTWYTLISRCWPVGDHTFYGFWARSGETKQWTHLVTMDVAAKAAWFKGGTDAFLEDWLETGLKRRESHLRGGWKRKLSGAWHPFGKGRYSVNYWDLERGKRSYNFRTNWNGGVAKDKTGEYYFMIAGGKKTKPTTKNPSSHSIQRTEKEPGYKPIRIKSIKTSYSPDGKLTVTWENDPTTLPQFAYSILVITHSNLTARGKPLAKARSTTPHAREAELKLPTNVPKGALYLRLECEDILGNTSKAKTVTLRK